MEALARFNLRFEVQVITGYSKLIMSQSYLKGKHLVCEKIWSLQCVPMTQEYCFKRKVVLLLLIFIYLFIYWIMLKLSHLNKILQDL